MSKPFDHEIEAQLERAAKTNLIEYTDSYKHYCKGVEKALDWVLGNVEYPPMEE